MRRHVDGDDRAVLVGRGLEAAGDVRAAAERDHDGVGVEGRAHDRLELRLAARADDDVGQAAEVAARGGGRGRAGSCRARGRRGPAASAETWAAPTAASSAARRSGARVGSATSSSSKPTGREARWSARTSMWRSMNGPSSGLSSCVNATSSSPQPHHFIWLIVSSALLCARGGPPRSGVQGDACAGMMAPRSSGRRFRPARRSMASRAPRCQSGAWSIIGSEPQAHWRTERRRAATSSACAVTSAPPSSARRASCSGAAARHRRDASRRMAQRPDARGR